MLFYCPKNNLAELLKILSYCEDNSLRITHYALRITHYALRITHYDDRRSPLTLNS